MQFEEGIIVLLRHPIYDRGFDYEEFRKTLDYNPIVVVESRAEAVEKVSQGKHILVFGSDYSIAHIMADHCDIVFLHSIFPSQERYLLFRNNYPDMDKINAAIDVERVNILRAYRKYVNDHTRDRCKKAASAPLSIMPYGGVLVLFLVGVFLGLTAFGAEFLFHKMF